MFWEGAVLWRQRKGLKDKLSLIKNFISSFLIDGSINNDTKSIENAEKIIFQTQTKTFSFNYKQKLFLYKKNFFQLQKRLVLNMNTFVVALDDDPL